MNLLLDHEGFECVQSLLERSTLIWRECLHLQKSLELEVLEASTYYLLVDPHVTEDTVDDMEIQRHAIS